MLSRRAERGGVCVPVDIVVLCVPVIWITCHCRVRPAQLGLLRLFLAGVAASVIWRDSNYGARGRAPHSAPWAAGDWAAWSCATGIRRAELFGLGATRGCCLGVDDIVCLTPWFSAASSTCFQSAAGGRRCCHDITSWVYVWSSTSSIRTQVADTRRETVLKTGKPA